MASVLVALHPGAAAAGVATVYQCQGPAGAAGLDLLAGPTWVSSPTNTLAPLGISNACPTGGPLTLGVASNLAVSSGDVASLAITPPPGAYVAGGRIVRQMLGDRTAAGGGPGPPLGYRLIGASGTVIERCGAAPPPGPQVAGDCTAQGPNGAPRFAQPVRTLPAMAEPRLSIDWGCFFDPVSSCSTGSGQGAWWGGVAFTQLVVAVGDDHPPAIAGASGSFLTSDPRRTPLVIGAQDGGLGVYRTLLEVDGGVVEAQPFDPGAASCRDADPANADPYEFVSGRPCPTAPPARAFGFAALPLHGIHRTRVLVEDAGGARVAVLDRVIDFDHPTRTPTLTLLIRGHRHATLDYGERATVRGRMTQPGGGAIAGVPVTVQQRVGAKWTILAGPTTGADGRFRYRVAAGPSRTLRFSYAPANLRGDVRLAVHAGITMHARRAVGRPGSPVSVAGRLRGAVRQPLRVELQAFESGSWRTFKSVGVNRRGRFSARYRFRNTGRSARFRFRAVARRQAGFPYATGVSRPIWVYFKP